MRSINERACEKLTKDALGLFKRLPGMKGIVKKCEAV